MGSEYTSHFMCALFAAVCASGCGVASGKGTLTYPDAQDTAARISAARKTATLNAECKAISPFYFEIGNKTSALVSASIGGTTYTANTQINIASASKWLFGAYVSEVRAGVLTQTDILATRLLSGYASMGNECAVNDTVSSCFSVAQNNVYTPHKLGRFHYSSGHFQKWGLDNGLASMSREQLADEYQQKLGNEIPLTFINPLLAGGVRMSADGYAIFLRKILNGKLKIRNLLGYQKTCTLTGMCATANYSPISEPWHYSIGHWIEDNPRTGDGSYSSAGAFGFYPWIDSTTTYYGIIAREDQRDIAITASINCGRIIRKAFMTGVAQ